MANNGGWNYARLNAFTKYINTEITKSTKALQSLVKAIQTIETGDGKTAYWSGSRAVSQLTDLRNHYNNDIKWINDLEKLNDAFSLMAKYKM